jgi:high-affinity nickel-transport protein
MEFYSFLFFALLMGIRHGLDPDHLAIINGITIQEADTKTSKWNGLMFSLGHGLTVTLVGVLIAYMANSTFFSEDFFYHLEWIPISLLLFTGFYNAFILINNKTNHHSNWKLKYLVVGNASLLKMFLIGLLFALVFDTASQTAAWSLAAQQDAKVASALLTGLVFTIGMIFIDTSNGILFSKAFTQNKGNLQKLQNSLGWLVVVSSLLLGMHQLLEKFNINIPVSDFQKTFIGLLIVLFTLWVRYYPIKINLKNNGRC